MDVLEDIKRLGKTLVQKLEPFLAEKKSEITTQRGCIHLSAKEFSILHINKKPDSIELLMAQTFAYDDLNNLPLILSGVVKRYELSAVPILWLLNPDDYQLVIIDAMPVPEDEIRQALNWRVKSLLSYPVEEAIIDYFPIPAKKSAAEHPMIAAVTTRHSLLNDHLQLFNRGELPVSIIDIPELALRNLTSLYEDDEKSTAFIYFFNNCAILNITRQKILYFSRRINLPAGNKLTTAIFEQLSLEVLRFFDYFQSQWRFSSPTRIFVAADKENSNDIAESLSKNLLTNVEVYTLKSLITDEKTRKLLDEKYLLAFGCALRGENLHAPTRD